MLHKVILAMILIAGLILVGCSQEDSSSTTTDEPTAPKLVVNYETPAVLDVPARMEPKSDSDWEAIANNKNAEIVEVLNILNPVAAYLTAAFEQYGSKFGEITIEEWTDTQDQLTKASNLYGECKQRMADNKFDKKLFLDLENAWQIFVKVGVAGLRTKTMVDMDLAKQS
ncbi:MAG: hypothetical protein GY841_07655 [FCB group bacterium]|nr:hypothetical protein [FCB group bacterium]